jgi:hypothetical protein
LRISVSRDDLLVLAARAKGFRNGSSSTALLEMAEAHRRERAMNALLRVLARTVRVIEDVEPVEERRRATGRGSPWGVPSLRRRWRTPTA